MTWPIWVGSLDGRPVMWVREILAWRGWRAALHKFVRADDPGCFHTHPAYAMRLVLWGGYVEEIEGGELRAWRRGDIGLVRPELSHRIHGVLGNGPAFTLWIRGPKVARIQLRGHGWPRDLKPSMGAELAP